MSDAYQWIEGAVAVEAVLQADSREVAAVYIREDRYDGAAARIQRLAAMRGVAANRVPAHVIAAHAHGVTDSVIAQVGPRRAQSLDSLLSGDAPVVVLLDGVEDPHNLGQATRSLYASGIDGLIVGPRNRPASALIRASAGASEWMPTAVAAAAEAVAAARAQSIPVAVAATTGARPMHEIDLTGPLLLLIGGEKRGVSRAVQVMADMRVCIPYGRDVPFALGVVGAAAVLGFEVLRQRRERGRSRD